MATLQLPGPSGLTSFTTSEPRHFEAPRTAFNRIAYSAAHVVADPFADQSPWLEAKIDWDRTIAYREYLWSLGLGVAEAMDTAQRGMGLDWTLSRELISRSLSAAKQHPGAIIASGVGTDHLPVTRDVTVSDVLAAYEMQAEAVEGMGGKMILMASRALVVAAKKPEDYIGVYSRILSGAKQPVILHWLGEMFDPALAGYWGFSDPMVAMDLVIDLIKDHADKVDGIKISLLDKDKEITMRRRLAPGVRMYTGDDFNYVELIADDGVGESNHTHSHALLGIFDAIAPAASAALGRLAEGDRDGFAAILEPTVPLSRHIFQTPTYFYKTGVVFLAYLNGHQDHFTMIGGQQSARSIGHLAELFRLADAAGLFADPDAAAARMQRVLAVYGVV